MTPGYLSIETHADSPGMVRIAVSQARPQATPAPDASPAIHYVAHFNDSEAAGMHAHELLKRRLVDVDRRLYRAPLAQAIAAVDSIDLRHQQVYIDSRLDDTTFAEIGRLKQQFVLRKRRVRQIFETAGYVGIAMLLFNLFILSR
jgi:hypothetical protein